MKRQIEAYLRARDVQYFRGHHDDEYFFLVDLVAGASSGRLNIHLEECEADAGAACKQGKLFEGHGAMDARRLEG